MFRRIDIVRDMLLVLLGAVIGNAYLSHAQVRMGAAVGYGETYAHTDYSHIEEHVRDRSKTEQLYAEARYRFIGIEGGWLNLPQYHTTTHTSDYPAYKGLAAGTYPQTVDGAQDIEARAFYGRLNLYAPLSIASPYVFLGRATVKTWNYEHPTYNGTDRVEYHETLRRTANYVGAGIEKTFGSFALRVEYGRIPKGTKDYHTLTRDFSFWTAGITYAF